MLGIIRLPTPLKAKPIALQDMVSLITPSLARYEGAAALIAAGWEYNSTAWIYQGLNPLDLEFDRFSCKPRFLSCYVL